MAIVLTSGSVFPKLSVGLLARPEVSGKLPHIEVGRLRAAGWAAGAEGLQDLAQAAVRHLKRNHPASQPLTVWIRGGIYRRSAPLRFAAEDSGTSEAPVSYQACDGELARILQEHPQAPLGNVVAGNLSYRSSWRDPERKYVTVEKNYITDDDPGFVDAAKMNFQLTDDSPVYRRIEGFRKIPFESMGLYQDADRASWPVTSDC